MAILDLIEDPPDFIKEFVRIPAAEKEPDCFTHRITFEIPLEAGMEDEKEAYAYGAGLSSEAAIQGCLGEASERYSGLKPDRNKIRFAAWKELGGKAVHPERFAAYSKLQFNEAGFKYVPFTVDTKVGWLEGVYLRSGEPVLVPSQKVYLSSPFKEEAPIGQLESTGFACGSTLEQATLGGLYEAVERDSCMIAWLNRLSLPMVEFSGPIFKEHFERPHLQYQIVQTTTDLNIPSYVVVLKDPKGWPYLNTGESSNLNPEKAIIKAATEALMKRSLFIFGRRRYETRLDGRTALDAFQDPDIPGKSEIYTHARFAHYADFFTASTVRIEMNSLKNLSRNDTRKDLETCLSILYEKGYDPIRVDITPPEIKTYGLTIVKILVPGFQPWHVGWHLEFLQNERLYQAPFKMGYMPRPATESEVNRIPHPIN